MLPNLDRFLVAARKTLGLRFRKQRLKLRPMISFMLMLTLLGGSVPGAVASSLKRAVASISDDTSILVPRSSIRVVPQANTQNRGMPSFPPPPPVHQPQPPPTKPERESRATRLELNTPSNVTLKAGQSLGLMAIPIDAAGNPIHGPSAEWHAPIPGIVSITKHGDLTALAQGVAPVVAKAGSQTAVVTITVVPEIAASSTARNQFAKRGGSIGLRTEQSGKVSKAGRRRASVYAHGVAVNPALVAQPVDNEEVESFYDPVNAIGAPPGKTMPVAQLPGAAAESTELPGSPNFSFDLNAVNLSGRGLSLNLGAFYNSLLWNKSQQTVTYNADQGWPAPGFSLGFGFLEDQSTDTVSQYMISEPDGTRHRMVNNPGTATYESRDGTFIRWLPGSPVTFADGTQITYQAVFLSHRRYPIQITDRHGNFMRIYYVGGAGPRIDSIQDTLGRWVRFKYVGNDLIAITTPGLVGQPERTVMRFYYQDITVNQAGLFAPGITVNAPATARVIKYIYLASSAEPNAAHTGYRYDYSAYGMIYQISQFRGMNISTAADDYTQQGTISNEGLLAALTTYNYPLTPSALPGAPSYTLRTDDWAGRTASMPDGQPPRHQFSTNPSPGISIVTAPDGTTTETRSIYAPRLWNNGLIAEIIVKDGANELLHTFSSWEQGANGANPRLSQVKRTNEVGQTTATVFTYDSSDPASLYNNVWKVSERDLTTDGSVSPTELRRTEMKYVVSSDYTSRGLVHMTQSTKVFAGGATQPIAQYDYFYDEGTPTSYSDISSMQYADPGTAARGNLTRTRSYPDISNPGVHLDHSSAYDVAGNVLTAQLDCCQQRSFVYPGEYFYAYATSITSGNGPTLTSSAAYDFNTGLIRTVTDENNQTSTIHYFPASLRYFMTVFPDLGYSAINYDDGLYPDPDTAHMHSLTMTTVGTGVGTAIHTYDFRDGRGAVVRHFEEFTAADNGNATNDIEYDEMDRVKRVSNPYYSTNGTLTPINPTGLWTTNTYDKLGRVTRVDMPSGDALNPTMANVQTNYAGTITTVTDQAGKQRRQRVDALGRVERLDEPNGSGSLGTVDTPTQPTSYAYDALDNLIHITQGAQNRYFKYDSLSRLTHERQVEQDAPWTSSDFVAGNNQWSRKIIYNSNSLVQDAYDAQQRRTQFIYDGLNRVSQINYFLPNDVPDPATPSTFYRYDSQNLPPGAPVYDRGHSAGRLVAMTYGSVSSPTGNYFGYDQMGRVLRQRQVTGANTYALSYTYNIAGQLTSETYHSNRQLTYGYDEAGRLSQVSEGATIYANGFIYQPHGGLSSETLGNGMVHSLSYNRGLQASEVKLKQNASGAELQRFNYLYGQVNQADGSVDTTKNNGQIGRIDGFINGAKQWDQRMVYDSLKRLSTAAEYRGDNGVQSWQTHYDYDRFGNRLQYQLNNNVTYEPVQTSDIDGNRNRLISTGAKPTTYDPAGNILSDAKFRNLKYDYDANGRQTSTKLLDNTNIQTSIYDCAGQRVQTTAGGLTRTMVYDIFGQQVADYSGGSLQKENIYRGGQLLSVIETPTAASPTGLSATPSSGGGSITLGWTPASGATNYRVERRGAGAAFEKVGTTASNSFTDNLVGSGSAYLYKVCAADGPGNCVSAYGNVALGATVTFPTDPTITSIVDDPTGVNVTKVKAAHITELRTAVNAVRSLAGWGAASWTYPAAVGDPIRKEDVRDLREKLDEALVQLAIQISTYTDSPLAGAPNGTPIRKTHITELRERTKSGSGAAGSGGSSGGVRYVLSDLQGSVRAVMSNNGVGTSAIVSRHDYLPFGEEIGSGTGLRTGTQGYGASDLNRQKYGLTERDDATGLDHTWWRKYENTAGRWTSPDPLAGGIANPQSFNRYAYVQNDPVNSVDPTGLYRTCPASERACVGGGGGYSGLAGWGLGRPGSENERAERLHGQRVTNARGGYGFLTSEEVLHNLGFQISYGYNADGSLWTFFNIGVTIGSSSPFNFLGAGGLDSWPPPNPYNDPYGWRTPRGTGPPMEQFPEKIGLGKEGVESRPEFDPTKSPSNASRNSRYSRAAINAIGRFLGTVMIYSSGVWVIIDVLGPVVMPNTMIKESVCRQNPNNPGCRGPGG